MTTVVVCYSLTGNTRRLAEMVALRLGAEVTGLIAPAVQHGPLAMLWLGFLTLIGRDTPVRLDHRMPEDADLVILAAPVWAGRVAFPMRAWLAAGPHLPRHRALIMTGGSPTMSARAMAEFARAAGGTPEATLYIGERALRAGGPLPAVDDFCARLGGRPPPARDQSPLDR